MRTIEEAAPYTADSMARSAAAAKKTSASQTVTKKPRKAAAAPAGEPLAALREEVAALRQEVARQAGLLDRARLDEIPRAEDFQPLADHLYAFAEAAPKLLAELDSVRQATETLTATHESWNQSLMHLPRAEDYEPLVGPLREFTQVSPVLAETLASVVRAVTPLPKLIEPLLQAPPAGAALAKVRAARAAIEDALATLPRDAEYASAAAHLRELATVSPSLLEWMQQLPALTAPLSGSVEALRAAARDLEDVEAELRGK